MVKGSPWYWGMLMGSPWYWGMLILLVGASAPADSQDALQVARSSTNSPDGAPAVQISSNSFLTNLVGMDLVDQSGQSFQPTRLVDRVVLFNFIFTSCGATCPMQTRILSQVYDSLPAGVRDQVCFVSISIDPETDTPERLRQFAKATGADVDGWSFLTGDVQQIEQLTQRLHLFDESESGQANRPEIHRTSLWLVDKRGRMLQRYSGNPPDKKRLIRELTQVSRMAIH